MDLSKYLKLFISESQEHLRKMDELLLKMEQSPGDKAAIDTLFREAHSLKGMSASMGFEELAEISHRMEDYLDRFRGGKGAVEQKGVELLFEGVDLLKKGIEEIAASGQTSVDSSAFLAKVHAYTAHVEAEPLPAVRGEGSLPWEEEELRKAAQKALERGLHLFTLEVSLTPDAPLPAARAYIILKRLREIGELLRSSPSFEEVREGQFFGRLLALLITSTTPSDVQGVVAAMPDVAAVLLYLHPLPTVGKPPPKIEKRPSPAEVRMAPGPSPAKRSPLIRVDAKLLDDLMDQVGELITARGSLLELSQGFDSRPLKGCVGRIDGLIRGLQEQAMRLRMMPLGFIADRFPRAVRDLARQHGKELSFEIVGKEIELDRAILEELVDPLLHILRNAVDHGIEPPEERAKLGKPRVGTVRIEASQESEKVSIQVIDDGRGIDPERVKRIALEKGLITKEEHDVLSNEEALLLITKPGFSTKEGVSETSGRGVGMDVVRAAVESLRGSLEIESRLGVGTAITLKLPPSLAVIAVLLAKVGSEQYAIPLYQIQRSLEFSDGDVQRSQGQEVIVRDGRLIPIVRLQSILACPKDDGPPVSTRLAVLAEVRGREVGVVVDEVLGYRDAVVKPLGKTLEGIKGFAGVTVMGDGRMILILDLNTLL